MRKAGGLRAMVIAIREENARVMKKVEEAE
jgi:hypothetical protein